MKRLFISLAALALTLSLQAQSNLGYNLSHKVKVYNMQRANGAKGIKAKAQEAITVIGTLKDGTECPTDELNAIGVKVKSQHLGMVVMQVSMDKLETLGKLSAFSVINANNKHTFKNKQSRIFDHVAEVQDPTNLPDGLKQIYTGKGVIVGVIDEGFDFTHKNFKDANDNMRIKRVWRDSIEYNSPEIIDTLTSDLYTESHGTHTTGTAAGSYSGEYKCKDGTTISGEQGVAYESELLLSSGLDDDLIIAAIDNMLEYAKAQNKPLVINMSLGGNDAWMDGKNSMTTAMKKATDNGNAPGILICVAAGNEGNNHASFYKTFNAGDKISTLLGFEGKSNESYIIQLCSDDNTPFSVELKGYDKDGNLKTSHILDKKVGDLFSTLEYTRDFANDHDGRFNIEILGDDKDFSAEDGVAYYILEITATQACGIRFNASHVHCSNKLNGIENPDLFLPNDNNSLNNMIQNKYGFAVGAYASTMRHNLYSGKTIKADSPALGAVANFCSWVDVPYKNKVDSIGVDFIAPGSLVLSSINHFDVGKEVADVLCAKADDETLLGVMEGTSMSAPNASGIMALWLQACPTLTTTQVREIIKATADTDECTESVNPRRVGYGKINCLKGLQRILETYATGITSIDADSRAIAPASIKVLNNGKLTILKDGKRYNVAGQQM